MCDVGCAISDWGLLTLDFGIEGVMGTKPSQSR